MSDVTRFEGGIESLGAIEDARDAHDAVGRWWAQAILKSNFDNGADDPANLSASKMATLLSLGKIDGIESAVGGFAEALAHLSRERDLGYIGVDYHPDRVLMEAADMAGMPADDMTTFPWKSGTSILDGVASASLGYGNRGVQIFPPEPNTAQ